MFYISRKLCCRDKSIQSSIWLVLLASSLWTHHFKNFWWFIFSLEYSSNFAKLPHNFFVCSYCGKFVCSPPILTELLQRQRQSLSELNPPFILFYFPTSLNPFSLLYLSMSLHLYFSDFEQIYKFLMTRFQLILPVANHNVTKNLRGHKMLCSGSPDIPNGPSD